MRSEPVVFTSWKEIASYLGKGVRTVQRWEAQFGLPVQRPDIKRKGLVRATKDDLDGWIFAHWKPREQSPQASASNELEMLRRTVAELTTENARLQRELEERDRAYGVSARSRGDKLTEVSVLLGRCEQLLNRSAQIHSQAAQLQQQFAETMDITKSLRVLREETAKRRIEIQLLTYDDDKGRSLPASQGNS